MYELALGAIFKNEADNMIEYIEHYLYHGVDHLYLINDGSQDNYKEILEPYIQKGVVTLFESDEPKVPGRQSNAYNKFFLPIREKTKWLLIVDLDEFMYSPDEIDLRKLLCKYEDYAQVRVEWLMFGSNGFEKQPPLLVNSFFNRCSHGISYKSFVQTKFLQRLDLHTHDTNLGESSIAWLKLDENGNAPLIINHYRQQSLQRWLKRVSTRGDGDLHRAHFNNAYPLEVFYEHNYNDVEDRRLFEQNKPMLEETLRLKNTYQYT